MMRRNANRFDFDRAFKTWEHQKGYPVIHVHYNSSLQSFYVTQERFFQDKSLNVDDNTSWFIPINYATESNANFDDTTFTDYFIDGEAMWHIFAPQVTAGQWFIFNKQQLGYYRVNYEAENWQALVRALNGANWDKIHVMNRAQLIDDAFALTNAGYLNDYNLPFDLMNYLINEDDFFPWYTANRYINSLYTVYGRRHAALNVNDHKFSLFISMLIIF
jgi:aminopeptidase N